MSEQNNSPLLPSLTQSDDFISRHIGPSNDDVQQMLKSVEATSLADLIHQTVPSTIHKKTPLSVAKALNETQALARLRTIADKNKTHRSFIGLGYYDTVTPPVILRNVLENPGWYTAYTPYQPEIAQGRLEALLNFQQMVVDLTGMDLANASMLDEGTAAAEAMALSHRVNRKNRSNCFLIADTCHPQTIAVVKTRAHYYNIDVEVGNPSELLTTGDYFGVLVQYPDTYGNISNLTELTQLAKQNNTLVTVACDLLSLTLLTPPAEMGADIVIGNSQRFGVPLGFGGPHAAFFATRDEFKRSIPGRLIGVSIDRHNSRAYRMALQTREQHIRREKATSNICTSQALLAIMAVSYAIYHGPTRLKVIAQRVNTLTGLLAAGLQNAGITVTNKHFFDTITIKSDHTKQQIQQAEVAGFNVRPIDENHYSIALDEKSTVEEVTLLLQALTASTAELPNKALEGIPQELQRTSDFLTHPVFNSYHSETEMLRYLKRLESRDIALNHSMIALGSCTMKLNATAEMIPITWPEFANIHPFAPLSQAKGYLEMIGQLDDYLLACTGYDRISMQPNSGAQGEYAGLLTISRYQQSLGQSQRDICLIPASAHGTNPASAAMANMRVVIVNCDAKGNIDMADLTEKTQRHSNELAAIMVTYPSTHGVFEQNITEVCELIHQHGGQVYVDGANMNAMVGIAAPGEFGADVSHLNLHKTFAIPHGGGGPGMGPIGVKAHLAPFLPTHPLQPIAGLEGKTNDTVSAAPWGSAGILPISWAYITMMGGEGLTRASQMAILSANYLAVALSAHYPILYTGKNNKVAHECIIDIRPLKERSGISEEDIAKRLMDFGFHAPTMSFPVPGTLMIEPTESESKVELDRFIQAMVVIREEIDQVEKGVWTLEDNPLVNAPHTADYVTQEEWPHAYSRQKAAYPVPELKHNKYWPPVGRIDNVHGDRNLFCVCPPIESYQDDSL